MTRIILHIGPHKTGTTYIQATLHALCDRLLDQGIFVPSIWNAAPGLPSHMKLVWALRNQDLAVIQTQLTDILALGHRCLIISCEALSRLNMEQIILLRRLLGQSPTEVVYHVRRWPERLPSLWQETVKFGHTAGFPEFFARQLTRFDESELRDVFMIDRFATVFGANQVKLISYSLLVEQNDDIAEHFLSSFLGLPDIVLPAFDRLNSSLPVLDTEMIRALNIIHARRGGERSTAPRDWYLAHRNELPSDRVWDAMRDSLDKITLDEAAPPFAFIPRDLLARYSPSIVPPRSADGMHELRSIEVPYVRDDYLLDRKVTAVLHDIYDMFRKAI